MFDDDPPLGSAPAKPIPREAWSIEDLEHEVARMRAEIAACEALIAQKRSHRAAADAVFGAPKG